MDEQRIPGQSRRAFGLSLLAGLLVGAASIAQAPQAKALSPSGGFGSVMNRRFQRRGKRRTPARRRSKR